MFAIYLWNYCSGTERDGKFHIDFCSKPQKELFDQYEHWKIFGLDFANGVLNNEHYKQFKEAGGRIDDTFGEDRVGNADKKAEEDLKKAEVGAQDTINAATKAIGFLPQMTLSLYLSVLGMTVLSLIFGFISICTRFGSVCTTILSIITTLVLLTAAAASQALWTGVSTGVNKIDFSKFGDNESGRIHSKAGKEIYTLSYIAAALSVFASVFWIFSICCVSTKEKNGGGNYRGDAESSKEIRDTNNGLGHKLNMLRGHKYTPMTETYPAQGPYGNGQETGYVPQVQPQPVAYGGATQYGGRI